MTLLTRKHSAGAATALAWFLSFAGNALGEVREWTSAGGRTLMAEFVAIDHVAKTVDLRTEERLIRGLSLNALSPADRDWIARRHPTSAGIRAAKLDQLIGNAQVVPQQAIPGEEFLVRAYRKIVGRAPDEAERAAFLTGDGEAERRALVDALIVSEEASKYLSIFLAPLLRTESADSDLAAYAKCESPEGEALRSRERTPADARPPLEPYRRWIEGQLGGDRPWNELVAALVTASGRSSENLETGYLAWQTLAQDRIPSHLFTAFLGVEITCAACHNHPHEEVYQMDYLKLAAYFGELRFEWVEGRPRSEDVLLVDSAPNLVQVPQDYAYEDGEPGTLVSPAAYFGTAIDEGDHESLRAAFAAWLTSDANPRFTVNIVNRLWGHVFDEMLLEPANNLPGHLDSPPGVESLVNELSDLMKEDGYVLRDFLRTLYGTRAFLGFAEAG